MRTKGKFILCSPEEFSAWVVTASVSRVVTLIQNHHTFSPSYDEFNGRNHWELLVGMEEYHVQQRGFDMIAQNLTTFPDGTVAICRPLDRIPAGIKGANKGGICIEHLGNFNDGGDSMTDQHRNAIVAVNTALCGRFQLRPSTDCIVYHHWYDLDSGKRTDGTGNVKTCPGTAFFGGNSVANAAANLIPLIAAPEQAFAYSAPSSAEVTADLLNVRSGGGIDYPIVKQLGQGVTVQIFEERGGWCRIAADRHEWVNEAYLQYA